MKIAKQFLSLILIFVLLVGCSSGEETKLKKYSLVPNGNNILVEKFQSDIDDENKYNYNNEVFKLGTKFTYDYKHYLPDGTAQLFKLKKEDNNWEFVNEDNNEDSVVHKIIIGVLNGNPMKKYVPDYNQTSLSYKYNGASTFSMSGVIENEGNIWMHPPREDLFKILELNPFPYIKAPYEVGNEWTWNLIIGNGYQDARWALWDGTINNQMNYKITDESTLETTFGKLDCYVIESDAKSKLGSTSLTAYFNPKYGFIKLNYQNIDGSKTEFELVEHSIN